MSLNEIEDDVKFFKNIRNIFTFMSITAWPTIALVVGSVAAIIVTTMIALALAMSLMAVAIHFAYKQRKAELDRIR